MVHGKGWILFLALFGLSGSVMGSDSGASSESNNEESFQQWLEGATYKDILDELRLLRDDLRDADPSNSDFLDSTNKMIKAVQQQIIRTINALDLDKLSAMEQDFRASMLFRDPAENEDDYRLSVVQAAVVRLARELGELELIPETPAYYLDHVRRMYHLASARLNQLDGYGTDPVLGLEKAKYFRQWLESSEANFLSVSNKLVQLQDELKASTAEDKVINLDSIKLIKEWLRKKSRFITTIGIDEKAFENFLQSEDATYETVSAELARLEQEFSDNMRSGATEPVTLASIYNTIKLAKQWLDESLFQKWLKEDENRKRISDKLAQLREELKANFDYKDLARSIYRKINMAYERLEELELRGDADIPATGQERLEQEIVELMHRLRATRASSFTRPSFP